MKKLLITFGTLFMLLIIFVACNDSDLSMEQTEQENVIELRSTVVEATHYYWFKGERIALTVNMDYAHVIVNDGFREFVNSSSMLETVNFAQGNSEQMQGMVKIRLRPEGARVRSMSALSDYFETVDALKQSGKVSYVFPFFERGYGVAPIGTSDIFYLKLREENDITRLQEVAGRHNVQIVKQVPYTPLWYILSVQGSGFRNSIEASNYFFETGYFSGVDPAFMFNFAPSCVNDPYFNRQWGLRNTTNPGIDINACNAWTITRGTGINIAVIDTPIDPNHNDLKVNIHPTLSFDAQSGRSPSVSTGTRHGTLVAGTIAAVKNNGLQVVGVAPESRIIRVSHDLETHDNQGVLNTQLSAQLASGINWAWREARADVINNSWGDSGGEHCELFQLHSEILERAILDAMRLGRVRNGVSLGTIVIFASGNEAYRPNHRISYPGNFHPDILVVGGIGATGRRAGGSNFGEQLDVVAPWYVLSLTPNNGTDYDGGTSFAAPHVAGVAALMLSVNPNLRVRDVRRIINYTAQRIRPYRYNDNSYRPYYGTWNNEVGHGLVDAYAAVRYARYLLLSAIGNPTISGPAAVCANTTGTFSIPPLPAGVTVRWIDNFPLSIQGANNQRTVTVRHNAIQLFSELEPAGADNQPTAIRPPPELIFDPISPLRAEISINGQVVHTLQRDVMVNRPTVQSITSVNMFGQPVHTPIGTGGPMFFAANHNCMICSRAGTSVTWSITPNHGVIMSPWEGFFPNTANNLVQVGFTFPGGYWITVSVTNACGTYTISRNITVIGTSPPIVICTHCGTPSNLPPGCRQCPVTQPPGLLRNPYDPLIEKEQTN